MQLLLYLFLGWCILLLVFLAWWRPAFHLTTGATTLGVLVGMVYSWMYYQNAKRKDELQQLVRVMTAADYSNDYSHIAVAG